MTLKEAPTVLLDFYGVSVEAGIVNGFNSIIPDGVPDEVIAAWQRVYKQIS